MPTAALLLLSLVLLQAEQNPLRISSPDEIAQDAMRVPCKRKERLAGVLSLFEQMNVPPAEISVEKMGGAQNVIVRLAGSSEETIVIGAHYDFVDRGCGAIDNWSGVAAIFVSFPWAVRRCR